MSKKNAKKVSLGQGSSALLWVILLAATFWRLAVACSGSLGEREALLSVCASHPAGGYIEGSCGVPLLTGLILQLQTFGLPAEIALRGFSPLALLLLSWTLWRTVLHLDPKRPSVAFWSVLGINALPWVNLSALVMDGSAATGLLFGLALLVAVRILTKANSKKLFRDWLLFGVTLALGTLFFPAIGWLFPVVVALYLRLHGTKGLPWQGMVSALGLLAPGWLPSLIWNSRHDWIEWSSVAAGFSNYTLAGHSISLSWLMVLSILLVPALALLATTGNLWRGILTVLLFITFLGSAALLLFPSHLPEGLPSPLGVQGTGNLARALLELRKERPDAKGQPSLLIASTAGLASLLGEKISVTYPERLGAPSVFVAETPSMNSSFALWPSYADAVAMAPKDILYTEEKTISPFVGRNALYVTEESPDQLPQTIKGAFAAVALLKEVPLLRNGRTVIVRIYQCEDYRSLSL